MVQLAKDTGLTREGSYKALFEGRQSRLGTVLKVIRARTRFEVHRAGCLTARRNFRERTSRARRAVLRSLSGDIPVLQTIWNQRPLQLHKPAVAS